jgi:hypothetical protein
VNPILSSALGSILRYGLMILATFLVKKGIWTESAAEGYVEAAVVALLALGWSYWKIHANRIKLLTALTMPEGSTENDVKAVIASGESTPSVLTPANTTPTVV